MRLIVFALSVILSLWFSFFALSSFWASNFVTYAGYPILFTTFTLFVFSLFKLQDRWPQLIRWQWSFPLSGLVIAGCTVFLFLPEPFGFKVVMDEVILLGTSMTMHFEKTVLVPYMANDYEGSFRIIQGYLDKRPFFHPFLISLLHDLTGYRPANTFILNILLTPLLLTLVYTWSRRLTSVRGGILSLLLLTSFPLLAQNATGGHFEILNLVMILTVMLLACRYLNKLDNASLTAFVYAGLLLSQTRYESVVFVIPIGIIVLLGWQKIGKPLLPWPVVFAPFLLVCIPMQFFVSITKVGFWQLKDTGKDHIFGVDFMGENLADAAEYLFHYGQTNSNSLLLSGFGLVGLVFYLTYSLPRLRRFAQTDPRNLILSLFLLSVLASFALIMCYHWSHLTDPVASRFCLPLLLFAAIISPVALEKWPGPFLLTVCGLFGYSAWFHLMDLDLKAFIRSGIGIIALFVLLSAGTFYVLQKKRDTLNYLIGVSLLFIIFVTIPVASNHRYAGRYTPATEVNLILTFFRQHPAKDYFFTSRSAILPVVYGISSAVVGQVAHDPETIRRHILHHNYTAFYAYQLVNVDGETGELKVDERYDLGPEFEYETVMEERLIPLQLARIVRFYPKDDSSTGLKEKNTPEDAKAKDESESAVSEEVESEAFELQPD